MDLAKRIWTRSKQFVPIQNNLYLSKTIWTVQNNFGPIEGQGISLLNISGHPKKVTFKPHGRINVGFNKASCNKTSSNRFLTDLNKRFPDT